MEPTPNCPFRGGTREKMEQFADKILNEED